MGNGEETELTTRKVVKTLLEMFNAIRDSLNDLARSDDEQDGEEEKDDEEHMELGMRSEDEELGCVMGTISNTVKHRIESFRQMPMNLDDLTQPGSGEAPRYCCETDKKYGTAESNVVEVVRPQIDEVVLPPAPKIFGGLLKPLDIVPGIWQNLQRTCQARSSHMRLRSANQKAPKGITPLPPDTLPDLSQIKKANRVDPIRF